MPEQNKKSFMPVLVVLLIAAAFTIGMFWQRIQTLEKASGATGVGGTVAGTRTTPGVPAAQAPEELAKNARPVDDKDYVRGNKNAPITWIEYSDLECPFCKKIHPDLVKLMSEYEGKVQWVYRHFPLVQLHSKAPKEAEAAECVGSLGGNDAFWKFIDTVYTETPANDGLDHAQLPIFAQKAGVNTAAFNDCLASGKFKTNVDEDYQDGTKAGISGTPGNIVMNKDGEIKVIPGALPYEQLKATVDSLL